MYIYLPDGTLAPIAVVNIVTNAKYEPYLSGPDQLSAMIQHFLLSILWSIALGAASSAMTQDALGRIVLDLAPSESNPRNGEGDFITLKDGRIMFVYSRFTGTASDHAPATLVARFSQDGGSTWTKEDEPVVDREGELNVMSVSLLRLARGDIALFYMRKNSLDDCIPQLRISKDEGVSWGKPKPCIQDQEGYFVVNNDRVISLNNGRILVPTSLHKKAGIDWSHKGELRCYYSDDDGATWLAGTKVPTPDSVITQEPGLVQLKDGRIMMFIRASGGRLYRSYSTDGGLTWSLAERTEINSPISPTSIERLYAGDLMMVWNNNGKSGPGYFKAKRTPLTMAISRDEGLTWNHLQNIESDPNGFYCYTAIHEVEGSLLLSYVHRIEGDKGLGAYVRKIPMEDCYRN